MVYNFLDQVIFYLSKKNVKLDIQVHLHIEITLNSSD